MVKVKNMDIEEAVKLYDELQEREDVVNLHFSRMMAEMDRRASINAAKERAEEKAKAAIIMANKRANEEVRKANKRANQRVEEEVRKANKRANERVNIEKEEMIKNLLNQNVDKEIIMKAAKVDIHRLNQIIGNLNRV